MIKRTITMVAFVVILLLALPHATLAVGVNPYQPCANQSLKSSAVCIGNANGGNLFGPSSVWTTILDVLSFIAGATAVIVIVISAFKLILSGGSPSELTAARTSIIYASIGLLLIISANAIVFFVISAIH